MPCEWVEAQSGKRFVLTAEGAKVGKVKAKYVSDLILILLST